MRYFLIAILVLSVLFTACKKDKDTPPPVENKPTLTLGFSVDNQALEFDKIQYKNAAGNNYSVTKLLFYISAFEFEKNTGEKVLLNNVFLVDARDLQKVSFTLPNLPFGDYKSVKFLIGLDSLHNIDNGLPNTLDNVNMAWPTMMGGGYHFMKLEGNFLADTTSYGYAMHLGKNKNRVPIEIIQNFSISNNSNQIKLKMNLNEWYQSPANYDFNIDGNYSMHDSTAMAKLVQNGMDVFTLN